MKYRNELVTINPKHMKLVTALRTAVENGEGNLDKEATSHDDLFDAFRMSLIFWHWSHDDNTVKTFCSYILEV